MRQEDPDTRRPGAALAGWAAGEKAASGTQFLANPTPGLTLHFCWSAPAEL